MPTVFNENQTNDIFLNADGDLDIVTGVDAVAVLCKAAAEGLLGEAVLNVTLGMPNFQLIWNGMPNLTQYNAALRTQFINVPGVVAIQNLSVFIKNSTLFYEANILTKYGQLAINGGYT